MTALTIWIVSPLYFDVDSFLLVREKVRSAVEEDRRLAGAAVRFVVADDSAGGDSQVSRLAQFDDVAIVRPQFNLGHQRALVFALRTMADQFEADDLVVTLDSDGEDQPEDVPRLLEPMLDGPPARNAVALALRMRRRETLRFKLMYLGFRMMFRTLTGTTIRSGNFAAFRGSTAANILRHPYFDLCYSSTLVALDLPIDYVPCSRGSRFAGESKMGYRRLLMHGIRMLMPFTDRIAIRALLAFAAGVALSLLAGVAILAISLITQSSVATWAIGGIVALMGLSLLSLSSAILLFANSPRSRGISLSNREATNRGSGSTRPASS